MPPAGELGRGEGTRMKNWEPWNFAGGHAATETRAAGAGWLSVGRPSAPRMRGRAALARAGRLGGDGDAAAAACASALAGTRRGVSRRWGW